MFSLILLIPRCSKMRRSIPDAYRDLLVRVSGFTQYWVETGKPVQDEVVARTEFEGGV